LRKPKSVRGSRLACCDIIAVTSASANSCRSSSSY